MKKHIMTCEECKEAFRAVLLTIPIPARNRKILLMEGYNPTMIHIVDIAPEQPKLPTFSAADNEGKGVQELH